MTKASTTARARLLRVGILATTACLIGASPALAQDAATEADDGAIIVTAQKRAQDLQKVPISMAVVDGDRLSDLGIKDFTELDAYVPNFYVQATPGNNAFYIRGIGSSPGNLAFEQTVGLFVDGIYGGHARQFQAPFLDVERIEVLRGPQGALVGKNTSAGAISVVSAKPTSRFKAEAEYSHEFELGGNRAYGMVNGPLADGISARLAGQWEDADGYIRNTVLGGNETSRKAWFARGSLLIDRGGPIDLLLRVEGGKVDLTGSAVERFVSAADPDLQRDAGGLPGYVGTDYDNTRSFNASATVNIDVGTHTLTAISGYSSYSFDKRLDSDFGPANRLGSGFAEQFDQFSQEIRLVSPTDGALEYIVGGYFHVNDYDLTGVTRTLSTAGVLVSNSERFFRQENTAWSGFGCVTYKFGDALRVSGSIRYTSDKKDANQDTRLNGATIRTLTGKRDESGWDPSVNLQWNVTDGAMLYASWGQGSKAGGFIGGQGATLQSQFQIEPESSETWEGGVKLALLDRKLRVNLALFNTTFTNLQVSSYDAVAAAFITSNAGKSRSRGFEGDFSFQVTDGIRLSGSLAHLDAKYIDFLGAPCFYTNLSCNAAVNNAAGMPVPRSPKWSGTLGIDVVQPLSEGLELTANAGMTFRSTAFLEESYNPSAAQKAFQKYDLRVGLRSADRRWEVAVVGKNLTNVITAAHAFNTPLAAGVISKFIQSPRTIAVQAKVSF